MSGISSPRSWRPDEVRRKQFTVRFRGLDHNEVHGFLNALADDLARLYEQLTTLTQDNARLRNELQQAHNELQQAQVNPQDGVSDQAILLLDQAQQLADALIEEGMQSARDMMVAARSHQRVIVDPSLDMDHGAGLVGGSQAAGPDSGVSSEVEEARMFAKVAQVQFRAVLDALNEQVNRLGQVQGGEDREEFNDERQFTSNGASPFDRH
jgi:DivIVA domain-containing protein